MTASLKIALIVDDENLSKHDYQLIEWANSTATLRISHLIVHNCESKNRKPSLFDRILRRNFGRLSAGILWKAKDWWEQRELARVDWYKEAQGTRQVGTSVPHRIFVKPNISKSGLVYRYSDNDIENIRAESFDILFRCCSAILRGGILQSARLGILSFHHGDNRINRGGPAAFWEVFHGSAKTGFVVQKLTEELDGGDVLLRGFIATQRSHLLNRAALFNKSYAYIRPLLAEIASTGSLPAHEPHLPYSGKLYIPPTARELACYFAKRAGRSIVGRSRSALGLTEQWGVCFIKSDWPNAAFWRGRRITTPPGRFLADPFVVTRKERTCVFVEDYVQTAGKGRITAFDLHASGCEEAGVAIDEKFHLSFPFIFEHKNTLFMCPESIGASQIRIYRCTRFPLEWTLESIAMGDISAADSMIFLHADRWWLLTNLSEAQPMGHSSELHIFCSKDPLSGHWEAHRRNPVLIDPEYARNGGLLMEGGNLVRVCQSQGFGSYGAAVNLMRIKRINRDEYTEELICRLTPAFHSQAHGVHHLHSDGIYSAWDYKHWGRATGSVQVPLTGAPSNRPISPDYSHVSPGAEPSRGRPADPK